MHDFLRNKNGFIKSKIKNVICCENKEKIKYISQVVSWLFSLERPRYFDCDHFLFNGHCRDWPNLKVP